MLTPARALLIFTGLALLAFAFAGLVFETLVGVKVNGGIIWWRFALGLIALFVGTRVEHDRAARRVAAWLALALILTGVLVGGASSRSGFSVFDAIYWTALGVLLLIGAMIRDPREGAGPAGRLTG